MNMKKLITSKINELVGRTFEEKDYSAFNFLQWYVAEQHEEEKLFSGILDKLNLLGEDGKGLFLVDKDFRRINNKQLIKSDEKAKSLSI